MQLADFSPKDSESKDLADSDYFNRYSETYYDTARKDKEKRKSLCNFIPFLLLGGKSNSSHDSRCSIGISRS